MAERCSAPSDGDGDDTNAQRAKRRRAAPNPSTQPIDAADLRLLESLFAHDVDGVPSDEDTPRMELRDFRFLARGHKGVVYVANYSCAGRTGRVAIKVCRGGGARQEERWLQQVQRPGHRRLVSILRMGRVRGDGVRRGPSIGEALDGAVPPGVLFKALRDLLGQCARLDERGIDKREMNRCQKHVIVSREGRSTLLDFERCQESAKPSNVTGLAQYLTQAWAVGKLRGAGASVDIDAVRAACKAHKKAPSPKTWRPSNGLSASRAGAVAQRDGPGDGPDGLYERAREARHLAQAADAAAQPAPRVDPDGFVIPSMEQVEKWQGEWEEECACQPACGMRREDCSVHTTTLP